MKILIIGDLHGTKPKIQFKEFDCIIQIGDVCSDKDIGKIFKAMFKDKKKYPEKEISFEEYAEKIFGKNKIEKLEKESLKKGREIMKYLNSFNKPVFFVPGNWDQSYGKTRIKDEEKNEYNYLKSFLDSYLGKDTNSKLIKGLKNIKDCQYKLNQFNKINILGYGLSSAPEKERIKKLLRKKEITIEQAKKLKNAEQKIKNKLEKEYKKRNENFSTIFLTHNIPYNTKLDKIKNKESYANKKHLGSTIARDFVEKHKPLLCIGGHIHEGRGKTKIGKTLVINPGFGKNAQVLVEINENKRKIKKITFSKINL